MASRKRLSRRSPARRIHTHLTAAERRFLFETAAGLGPQAVVVEIGSYLGASTSFMAEGVRAQGGVVYAVDTWQNETMSEGPRDTYAEFMANVAPFGRHVAPLRGRSSEVAPRFHQDIDLLFVDGDHSFEAVRADLQAWLPKVRDGGIVACHDYNWAEGVRRAIRECLVERQAGGGRRLDGLYWTRVGPKWKLDGQLVASIVVPTCGHGATLREGLEALLGQEVGGTYEILVVDNNPAPEMEVAVRSIAGGHPTRMLRYIHEPKPGLLTARHRGAAEARSPIVVYVDDDIIVRPRWLNALLDSMADPEVGIAGGPVRPRWEVAPPEWFSQFPESYLSLLDLGNSSRELAWPGGVYGCNMAVRRLALYESGGFNPDATSEKGFPWRRGDGETGLHQKVFDASYKVVYTPLAAVEHIIPGDRLTRQAFYRRGLMVGLSWSYAALRNSGRGYRFYLKTLLRIAGAKIRVIRCCAWGLLQPRKRVRWAADTWLWCAYIAQHARALIDPELRAYVMTDSYLD